MDGWEDGWVNGSADKKVEWLHLLKGRALNLKDSSSMFATEQLPCI